MNYFCVRPELIPSDEDRTFARSWDMEQTYPKQIYSVTTSQIRPKRLISDPTDESVCPPVYARSRTRQTSDEDGGSEFHRDAFALNGDLTNVEKFDFYLAVPEEDLELFGIPFCEMVEKTMNMKPCLMIRDILPGQPLFETIAYTVETRCNGKVVFVVSKNFYKSAECQFLVHFAKSLDPDAMSAKLIPLEIDKNVQLPRVLEGLSSINYNAAMREKWLGKRLWEAIHGTQPRSVWARLRSISSPS